MPKQKRIENKSAYINIRISRKAHDKLRAMAYKQRVHLVTAVDTLLGIETKKSSNV